MLNAHLLANKLKEIGFEVENKEFFDEFTLNVGHADGFLKHLKQENILAGIKLNNQRILVSVSELNTVEEIEKYIDCAKKLSLNKIS